MNKFFLKWFAILSLVSFLHVAIAPVNAINEIYIMPKSEFEYPNDQLDDEFNETDLNVRVFGFFSNMGETLLSLPANPWIGNIETFTMSSHGAFLESLTLRYYYDGGGGTISLPFFSDFTITAINTTGGYFVQQKTLNILPRFFAQNYHVDRLIIKYNPNEEQ